MADWLVHYASGRIAAVGARGAVLRECLFLGVVLPDVPSKFFDFARVGQGWAVAVSHTPILWAAMAYALSHVFREPLRPSAFGGLLLGGWLHILVDVGKETMGHGAAMLAFPFSMAWQDLGWYHHEDTLRFAPWALGAILAAEAAAWWGRRSKRAGAREG